MTETSSELDYHALNAMLNLYDDEGKIQFDKDKEAARQFFLQHVNQNTVFFHSLEEKLNYLVEEGYYEAEVLDQYKPSFLKRLWKKTYAHKFRFPTFMGALKYYTSYTLKTRDGKRYLERYEDRVAMNALLLARGDEEVALSIMDKIITGQYQPATPTFLNAGKKARGELVSCFLLRVNDSMNSIARAVTNSLQLSKRGGGVALMLTNLRESGAPIKGIEGQASGVIPVMKMLEDAFSYANQLGARSGAGAVYLHAHHPDIMKFLDTKRENADEKIRIKTLSLGVVVPDITLELAKANKDMYLFSPYDVYKVYGVELSDLDVTAKYQEMVDDKRIAKKKINARVFFQTLAEIQFESGYPYILFVDNANRQHHAGVKGVNMSNLCSEILQENQVSSFNEDQTYSEEGQDISCNLGSLNIAKVMDGCTLGHTVETAVRALTAVSDMSNLECSPSVRNGNEKSHAIGLGQMNLHGFLAREGIHYDSPEAIEFTSAYFAAVAYYAINASCKIAEERGETYHGFEDSKYADGTFFEKYTSKDWRPQRKRIVDLFADMPLPSPEDWAELKARVMQHGIYNKYLQAVPPTGSISYINNSTSSIHPIVSKVEIRKEGRIGRVYYPAAFMTNDNLEFYKDAYEIGWKALIDVYAAATEHVDQGLSLTLFFPAEATTRDINKAQIYAFSKGIKTIYYVRLKQQALEGTGVEGCVSCQL